MQANVLSVGNPADCIGRNISPGSNVGAFCILVPQRCLEAPRVAIRRCGSGSIDRRLGEGQLAFHRVDGTQQIVTPLNLPLHGIRIREMRLVVDASPIRFGSNCVLKRFRITIVFGDREFDPRDVNQCRAGRPPPRIGLMRRNHLFDALSMRFRSGQAFLQNGDQGNGQARIVILEPLRHLPLAGDLVLDLSNSALCQFQLCVPRVHLTPRMGIGMLARPAIMART